MNEEFTEIELAQLEDAYMLTMQEIQYEMCNKETRIKIKSLMESHLPDYQIKCDEENNPPSIMESGHIVADVICPKTYKRKRIKF